MKLKRIMLITLVLLAILTIGAVSASDDTDLNETLTVDDVDEVSVDASVDDDVISESDDDEVVAVSEEDIVSDGNSTLIQPELAVSVRDADMVILLMWKSELMVLKMEVLMFAWMMN